ncbi:hypothetical protein CISIN_1g034734mg [Citrus sinensis]|uniref:Uncharacterized protein n=1 Tax=Citrus sinensis TaxID=2711 RepID=A0A067DEA8_CITSI|nr:hypothetical protein CISIN_1g034734mg [Citrus sinensis]
MRFPDADDHRSLCSCVIAGIFSLLLDLSIQNSIQSFCSTQPLIVNTQSSIALCSLLKTLSLIVLFNTASHREDTVFDRSVLSIQR